ncbi:hypothetical protein [Allokutzneria oryzae]|uniref:Uncharacterized protein n=1 Tax=Allokutzneria oryzae TaxID=1378989 RepID=A0ABV6A8X3_9PSEU
MRIMRVSLVVGAVVAAVATGGTAVAASAAAKSPCYVVAKRSTPVYDFGASAQAGTLKKGQKHGSACSPVSLDGTNVVFLNRRLYVMKADVSIKKAGG